MSMAITQQTLDQAALVLIVDEHGLYEWSATKPAKAVATQLRRIARDIAQAARIEAAS